MKASLKQLTMTAAIVAGTFVSVAHASSDDTTRDLDAIGSAIRPAPADPAIAHALQQISSQQIQHTIETLVGFHTRNTLSSMAKDLPQARESTPPPTGSSRNSSATPKPAAVALR